MRLQDRWITNEVLVDYRLNKQEKKSLADHTELISILQWATSLRTLRLIMEEHLKLLKTLLSFLFFGNFVAYPAENIRNVANITNRSIAEMGFKKTPELVQAMRQIAIKKEGQLRGLKGDALNTFIQREIAVPDVRLAEAEQLASKFVTEINAIGVRRATGALATIFMSGPVATKSLNQFSNANNEQQEATRELLANYAKGEHCDYRKNRRRLSCRIY